MKIIFFVHLTLVLINYGETSTENARKYCLMSDCLPNQSVACEFTSNSDIRCNGEMIQLDKDAILSQHNNLRSRIASGDFSPRFQTATRMGEMFWSDELAEMAEFNVKRCFFEHDQCHNIKSFPKSGQSLAITQQIGIPHWNVHEIIERGINKWFNQYKFTDMSVIDNFHNTGKMIRHFAMMVKDTNTHVGCAASRYRNSFWDTILLACNYAETNIVGTPTYESGPTASRCSQKSDKYRGLCSKL